MSAAREAKAKENAFASGAKPRLEERVREQRRRRTSTAIGFAKMDTEAARRRAIEQAPTRNPAHDDTGSGGAE
jgi:hypothetical protein